MRRTALLLVLLAGCATGGGGGAAAGVEREAVARMGERTPEGRARAAALFEEAAALRAAGGERRAEGIALLAAATQHHFLGRPARALPLADSALSLLAAHGYAVEAAEAETLCGELAQSSGDAAAALALYRRARARLAAAPERDLPRGAAEYAARLDARLLSDIGNSFIELALADSAARYLERARLGRIAARDSLGLAVTLNNLGRLELTLGRAASARRLFAGALAIARGSADPLGEATVLANAGYSFDLESRPDSALAYHRLALQAAKRAGQESLTAVTLINLGRNQIALGAVEAAADDLTTALAMKREVGDSSGVAWALHDLGRVEIARGNRAAAVARLGRSREMLRASGDRVREASALFHLARASDGDRALPIFAETHAVRGGVGAQLALDADRITFNEQDAQLTEEWVAAWLEREVDPFLPSILASLAVADLGRGRALLRLLRSRAAEPAPPADLAAAGRALASAIGRSGASAGLYYLTTRERLRIWTIGPSGEVASVLVPVGRDSLAALTRAARAEIDARRATTPTPAMRALAAALLPPAVRAALPREGEVIVLPQGVLNLVPFAALPLDEGGEPLGIRYALRYSPSLAALAEVEALPARVRPRPGDATVREALVIGDPAMPTVELLGLDGYRPSQLPWADSSSREVARLLGAPRLTGREASETALRRLARGAPIVHLETHGFAFQSEAEAQESFVVLAASEEAGEPPGRRDGRLTIAEILGELPDLSAELVVLAACQTGLGDLKQAEGTVGLQRAFLAKKARTVLVSLWSVDDRASARLSQAFYRHWLAGNGKAEALRRAQAEVRADSADPYLWAAFQLVGAG